MGNTPSDSLKEFLAEVVSLYALEDSRNWILAWRVNAKRTDAWIASTAATHETIRQFLRDVLALMRRDSFFLEDELLIEDVDSENRAFLDAVATAAQRRGLSLLTSGEVDRVRLVG